MPCFRFLPEDTLIFGYARSKLSDEELRKKIRPGIGEGSDQDDFLSKIKYISGQYDGAEGYQSVRMCTLQYSSSHHQQHNLLGHGGRHHIVLSSTC